MCHIVKEPGGSFLRVPHSGFGCRGGHVHLPTNTGRVKSPIITRAAADNAFSPSRDSRTRSSCTSAGCDCGCCPGRANSNRTLRTRALAPDQARSTTPPPTRRVATGFFPRPARHPTATHSCRSRERCADGATHHSPPCRDTRHPRAMPAFPCASARKARNVASRSAIADRKTCPACFACDSAFRRRDLRFLNRNNLALPRKRNQIEVAVQVLDGLVGEVAAADGIGKVERKVPSREVKLKFTWTLLGRHRISIVTNLQTDGG